jgi:hypothetical protein
MQWNGQLLEQLPRVEGSLVLQQPQQPLEEAVDRLNLK